METGILGTLIVAEDDKIYIVKKKFGLDDMHPFRCRQCVFLDNCLDYLKHHGFSTCVSLLVRYCEETGDCLILREPFKLTERTWGKSWPLYSVVDADGAVGIVVTVKDLEEYDSIYTCKNCILKDSDCDNTPCLRSQRKDGEDVLFLDIEKAIQCNLFETIKL